VGPLNVDEAVANGVFSDDLCMIDIPDTLRYVLDVSRPISGKLSYIGFSQGSAQAFAALSVSPQLNNMVDVFIAIAPAFSPSGKLPHSSGCGKLCSQTPPLGLSPGIVDALMKVSPNFLFLFLGRKVVLPSTVMWQSILCRFVLFSSSAIAHFVK
jgi:lysosomal acid lipase/cholesteryl ester hydrolase